MTAPNTTALDPEDIHAAVVNVVTAVSTHGQAVSGFTMPDRVLAASGGLTYDCEMFGVSVMSIQMGMPDASSAYSGQRAWRFEASGGLMNATVDVALVRDAKEQMSERHPRFAPAASTWEQDLVTASRDAAVLTRTAVWLSTHLETAVPFTGVQFGQPQGNLRAVRATLTVPLWDVTGQLNLPGT